MEQSGVLNIRRHQVVFKIVATDSKAAVKAAGMMQAELVCCSPCVARIPVMGSYASTATSTQQAHN
jgi:hypothetical protein